MWRVYLLEFIIVVIISLLWVNGIVKTHQENEETKLKNQNKDEFIAKENRNSN